jgi:hypothetical protein
MRTTRHLLQAQNTLSKTYIYVKTARGRPHTTRWDDDEEHRARKRRSKRKTARYSQPQSYRRLESTRRGAPPFILKRWYQDRIRGSGQQSSLSLKQVLNLQIQS